MSASTAALLDELAATHHVGRIRRMLELGRAARTQASALALVDALGRGDVYQRRLAVHALATLGDGGRLLPFTEDVSGSIRNLAFSLVPAICDDAQGLEAVKIAFALRRERGLVQGLARRRRRPVVDLFLDWLALQPGLHDFADLVPYATPAGVQRHLERALARPSRIFWERLARGCPAALAEILIERLAALPPPAVDERGRPLAREPDPVTRQLISHHLDKIAEGAPDHALGLLERLLERGIRSNQWAALRELGRTRPRETLALSERTGVWAGAGAFARSADVFDEAELARIVRQGPALLGEATALCGRLSEAKLAAVAIAWCEVLDADPKWGFPLLGRLRDPELRARAYGRWSVAARDRNGVIPVATVRHLPPELRELEARRHLHEVIALHTRPMHRIPYARFLPWDEADAALKAYLGSPEGASRGVALTVLLAIPGLRPDAPALVDRALAMVLARKNEQDPVRLAMITALCQWPQGTWRKGHVPSISRILRDALDAGDLSDATARAAESLLLRTFRLDPAWGAERLGELLRERGRIYDVRLGDHLSDADVEAAAPHLLAIARGWSARERAAQLVQLAASLGDRIARVPGLGDLLEAVMRGMPYSYVSVGLLGIFACHDLPRYERVVGAELRRWLDAGWYGELLGFAARRESPGRRQPTLHPEVGAAVEVIARGRGTAGHIVEAVTLLRVRDVVRFDRILPELLAADESYIAIAVIHWHLHERRQDLLGPFLGARVIRGRFATGKTAWLLPFERGFHRWTPDQNQTFAGSLVRIVGDKERDTPTVWRCLRVHANLDSAAMEPLAALADDDRPAIQERAIRVMARCDRGQCVPTLLRCLEDARARIAIYGFRRAVKDMLPARALTILAEVQLTKVTVAKEVVRLLGELRSEAAYARLVDLDRAALHRDVRIAMLRALWDHLEREPTWEVFARAVRGADWVMASRLGDIPADRLTTTSDRRLSALLGEVLERPEPEARIDLLRRAAHLAITDRERRFLEACAARMNSIYDDEVQAAMYAILYRADEVDITRLPGLLRAALADPRCLHRAIDGLLAVAVKDRWVWIEAARAAEQILAEDPRHIVLRIRCAAAALWPRELAEYLVRIGEGGALHADALAACERAIGAWPLDELAALAEPLRRSRSAEVRRIAVWALVRDAGPDRGWSDERLEVLAELQRDPSPLVAGAALAIFPPREMIASKPRGA
ncbi:MAG: hypothetical protein R3B09_13405 [Nannocystaceae bacterium]